MILQSPTISGSVELTGPLEILGTISASRFEGDGSGLTGLIAPVAAVEFANLLNKPALVSGSAQINYSQISNRSAGIISSSAQFSGLGNLLIGGHIRPSVTDTYDLGSTTLRWRDLFLSGSSLHLGPTKLNRNSDGDIEVLDSDTLSQRKVVTSGVTVGTGATAIRITNDNGRLKFVNDLSPSLGSLAQASGSFSGSFQGLSYGVDSNNRILFTDTHISYLLGSTEEFRMTNGGDFHADGDIIGNSTTIASDATLKTNVKKIENSINKLKQIDGVEFEWIKDNKPSIGVIAQQVQEVFPQLISEVQNLNNEGNHLTVNYSALVGVLIEAVKDLQAQVDNLKDRLDNGITG